VSVAFSTCFTNSEMINSFWVDSNGNGYMDGYEYSTAKTA
jgi:hypothetical protein